MQQVHETRDVSPWLTKPPIAFQMALAWKQYGPRGKSAAARLVGRSIGRTMRASVRLASGAHLAIDPDNLDIYVHIAASGGYWDEHVTRTLGAIVQEGDIVYDIGANAGAISIDLASRFKDRIKLIAIEPIPSLAQNIALSVKMNELSETMQVFEFLLGDRKGEMTLYIPSHAIHASMAARGQGARPLKRDMYKLDDLIGRGVLPAPSVVKIDVEGGELSVFRGALETIRVKPPVILFEADDNMRRFGYTRADLLAQLRAAHSGYRFYYVQKEDARLRLANDEGEPINSDTGNMVAAPSGRWLE